MKETIGSQGQEDRRSPLRHRVLGPVLMLLACGLLAPGALWARNWKGIFDGKVDARRIHTSGNNLLVVERAYVWDNGEGKHPDGTGSDRAWYGWKHGPKGNFHVKIYAPDQRTELKHTRLHGPWHTHKNMYEWKDDEGLEYVNYGLYDWDSHPYTRVYIWIYESDPPNGWGRRHDTLMTLWVDRDSSRAGVSYSSYHIPTLDLRTVRLAGPTP